MELLARTVWKKILVDARPPCDDQKRRAELSLGSGLAESFPDYMGFFFAETRALTRAATFADTFALTLAATRAFTRGRTLAEIGALTLGVGCDGVVELATMAFLVVFKLLISDFFWMLTMRSWNLVLI